MKKIAVSSLVSLWILSCSIPVPNNSQDTSSSLSGRMQYAPTNHYSLIKEDFTALAKKYNFAELEKEYKSFSTKALADTYVKKMFNKFLIVTPNSVQVIRQVEFSRYLKNNGDISYETSLKNIFTDTPLLYSSLTGMPAIQSKMTSESGTFGFYVLGVSPNQTVPNALPATNITETSFTANWSAVTGATSYILIVDGVEITGITGTNHTLNTLTAGSNHKYSVKAITSGVAGAVSNEINVNTILTAPTASSATGITQTSLTANWSQVSAATSYTLVLNGTEIAGLTGTSHTLNALNPGTTYSYYVKSVNANTESANSGTINTVTISATPTANVASNVGQESFTAVWGSVVGATGYKLTVNGNETDVGNVISKDIKLLTSGTNYSYSVKSYNASGTSGSSSDINTVTLTPSAGTLFNEIQSIPTNGTADWESFTIGSDTYLVTANSYNDVTRNIDSKIYKWNNTTNQFGEFQSIPTNGASDWDSFKIGTDTYLALSNSFNDSTYSVNSKIFKWNGSSFAEFQTIPTFGGTGMRSFTIGTETYLAVSNGYNGSSYNTDSKIYKWNNTTNQFVEFQTIPTNGANDWEFFTIGTDSYIAVANKYNNSSYSINSKIYKWNGSSFVESSTIPTVGVYDLESFTIGTDTYLAVANYFDGYTNYVDSKIYKWNGSSFAEFQTIPTMGALSWKSFRIGTDLYLAVTNFSTGSSNNIDSKIYKWNGSSFVEYQSVPTNAAFDWEYFTIGSGNYLVVTNHYNGTTWNLNSKIYKWQ